MTERIPGTRFVTVGGRRRITVGSNPSIASVIRASNDNDILLLRKTHQPNRNNNCLYCAKILQIVLINEMLKKAGRR